MLFFPFFLLFVEAAYEDDESNADLNRRFYVF